MIASLYPAPLQLKDVQLITPAAPLRWCAKTLDNRTVDIRLRHGDLTVRIGTEEDTPEQARTAELWFDDVFEDDRAS